MQAYLNSCSLEYFLGHRSQTCSSSDEMLSSGEEAWVPVLGYWVAVLGLLVVLEGALVISESGASWSVGCMEFMSPKCDIGVSV